jgi:hypothetical protein
MALYQIFKRYPTVTSILAGSEALSVPIDVEAPRKNFEQSKKIAEAKIEELKKLVRDDLEDFRSKYLQVEFARDNENQNYQYFAGKKKEIREAKVMQLEENNGQTPTPKDPKGFDEGWLSLFTISNKQPLVPGIEYEHINRTRGSEQYKVVWVKIGFSWEPSEDPAKPKIYWWDGAPISPQPDSEWKRKAIPEKRHEFNNYSEIERFMSQKLNIDEIIRNTKGEHKEKIQKRIAHLLEEVRNVLKPLSEKTVKFGNFPTPVKLHMEEKERDEDGDQLFEFKIVANPKKAGYEPFKVLYTYVKVYGGEFHTPTETMEYFEMYFTSHYGLESYDADADGDIQLEIDKPDFTVLKNVIQEIEKKLKRKVPVFEVDEDELERAEHKFKVGQRIELTNDELGEEHELKSKFGTIEELTEDDGSATYTVKFDDGPVVKHLYADEFILEEQAA